MAHIVAVLILPSCVGHALIVYVLNHLNLMQIVRMLQAHDIELMKYEYYPLVF